MADAKNITTIIDRSSGQRPTGNHLRSVGIEHIRVSQGRGNSAVKERRAGVRKIKPLDRVIGIIQLIGLIVVIFVTALVVDLKRE